MKDVFCCERDRITGFQPFEYERDKPFYKFLRSFFKQKVDRVGKEEAKWWFKPYKLATADLEDWKWFIQYVKEVSDLVC